MDHNENMFFTSHLKNTFNLASGEMRREVWQAIVYIKERAQRKHVGKDFAF